MNGNFTVINKDSKESYEVFDVTYNNAGYPHFLVYKDGQWLRMSAKYFRPVEVIDFKDVFKKYCFGD